MTVYDFFPILFADVQDPTLTTEPRIYTSTDALSMECYAGETTTATLNVTGANLTGDITIALNDADGVFSIDVTTIALADVANGAVTVTYAPQAVGTNNATITLSSEGAPDVTINLTGTATAAPLVVYDPVMLPADESKITATSFRADWTDQTVPENVVSYTLEVKEKPSTGGLIAEADWSDAPSSGSATMPEGWTVGPYTIYNEGGSISITSDSYIKTNTLEIGTDKVTVVFKAKNYYGWTNSGLTISTSVDSKYFEFTSDFAEYTVVLNCAENDEVEFYGNSYYPQIQWIKIYSGEVTAPQLRATEEGDASSRLITGITDKFYTVNNLLAEGTYNYRVKALYTDGTESAWSNKETVTLFDNGPAPHEYALGDVNHDKAVDISDVTDLIDYLLGIGDVCTVCADFDEDNEITINDVTSLIDFLLGVY
jgi:hypothetical protein